MGGALVRRHGLTGVTILGVAPIPLTVTGGPIAVGVVVAAFFLGGLAAPMIGSLAGRAGRQRQVFWACFPVMALAVAAFGMVRGVPLGALRSDFRRHGTGGRHDRGVVHGRGPSRQEWNERISWFRLA
ncbi:MAG TPA: hypothetical protein VMU34_09190 [Mycobacterium sp.]|nr:hypothetical protein [Mycobacterium sp.]